MIDRPLVIAANWKMHKTRGEASQYMRDLAAWMAGSDSGAGVDGPLQVVIAPPATAIAAAADMAVPASIYAQTMHQEDHGAFTGELSAAMLKDAGATGVILGHSERRQLFGETDAALADKVAAAAAHGLHPMLCIGETIDDRRGGTAHEVVTRQVRLGLAKIDGETAARVGLSLAYEPVWAIGTGETATPEIAQEMHAAIRVTLAELWGEEIALRTPILYGGSVKPANALELLSQPDIDGALVGGAALDVPSFSGIIDAAAVSLRAAVASS